MLLIDFLEAVVPSGHLVTARKSNRGFTHAIAKTHRGMASAIVKHARTKRDTYFALAAYKEGWHKNAKGKKVLRTHENVAHLKALWLDIDFKDGHSGVKEAALAIATLPIPTPSILTHSGNGVHAYWPLVESIPLEEWLPLAQGLKNAVRQANVHADPVCTADPARVLRPPGTINWKDPDNPKRVKVLRSTGRLFTPKELRTPDVPSTPDVHSTVGWWGAASTQVFQEFTAGHGNTEPNYFRNIIKHCGVSAHIASTHGAESSEPEWFATLGLLKHCDDADLWVHAVSKGHPGYEGQNTTDKWNRTIESTAGPTLCSTFEDYYPEICRLCPKYKEIKSPIVLGREPAPAPDIDLEQTDEVDAMPKEWRYRDGITQKRVNDGEGNWLWAKVLDYEFRNLRPTKSSLTGRVEYTIDVPKAKIVALPIPGAVLGSLPELAKYLHEYGVALGSAEPKEFMLLMTTWIKQLQAENRVTSVTEQLGWVMDDGKYTGFTTATATYHADGKENVAFRAGRSFEAIAKHYTPAGEYGKWREVADFLATQNNPAFTAILASAFAAPIFKFNGTPGAIISIVSTESGVGKTSVLKCAQAVWGHPIKGANTVDDTPNSVIRKLAFLNNIPAYWDELRGEKVLEDFKQVAFKVAQGKDKSRLTQRSHMQEIHDWETLLICAANGSIFDLMAEDNQGSDAGQARTFEIFVDPFESTVSASEASRLFAQVHDNYGHGGDVYAKYLSTRARVIATRLTNVRTKLDAKYKERQSERFWFAVMASLIVGAMCAKEAGIVAIDVKELSKFLGGCLKQLRKRTATSLQTSDPGEVLGAYIQQHQDKNITVDKYPPRGGYRTDPIIYQRPASDKVITWTAQDQQLIRFSKLDFEKWHSRSIGKGGSAMLGRIVKEMGGRELKIRLAAGTACEVSLRRLIIEVPLD